MISSRSCFAGLAGHGSNQDRPTATPQQSLAESGRALRKVVESANSTLGRKVATFHGGVTDADGSPKPPPEPAPSQYMLAEIQLLEPPLTAEERAEKVRKLLHEAWRHVSSTCFCEFFFDFERSFQVLLLVFYMCPWKTYYGTSCGFGGGEESGGGDE